MTGSNHVVVSGAEYLASFVFGWMDLFSLCCVSYPSHPNDSDIGSILDWLMLLLSLMFTHCDMTWLLSRPSLFEWRLRLIPLERQILSQQPYIPPLLPSSAFRQKRKKRKKWDIKMFFFFLSHTFLVMEKNCSYSYSTILFPQGRIKRPILTCFLAYVVV